MKYLALFAGAALLASCGAKEEAAPPEAAASETVPMDAAATPAAMSVDGLPAAGTYDVVDAEKKSSSLTIAADNTYAYTTEAGVQKGTVAAKDGKACYDPEGDKDPTVCWTSAQPAADGTWTATSDDGQTVTVKRAAG